MPTSPLNWIKRILTLAAVVLMLGGVWAGVYAASKGLTKKWRGMVQEEFHRHGISLSLRRLTLDPFHGLVAKDVRFYRKGDDKTLIASMDRLALDVSLIALARDELFLNHIQITDAEITIPLTAKRQRSKKPSKDGSDELVITNFNGRIHLNNQRISISNAEGSVLGIDFLLNAEFLHKDANDDGIPDIALSSAQVDSAPEQTAPIIPPAPGSTEWNDSVTGALTQLHTAATMLGEIEYPGGAPRITIDTKAELDALEDATVNLNLVAPSLFWRDRHLKNIAIQGAYSDGVLTLRRCGFADEEGEFDGELEFVRSTKRLRFSLRSQTQLLQLVQAASPSLRFNKIHWLDAPLIELAGELDCSKEFSITNLPGQIEGLAACGKTQFFGVPFDYISLHFACQGDQTFLRSIKARHQSGLVEGDILRDGETFKTQAVVTAHPEELTCFAFGSRPVENFLTKFHCTRSSRVSGKLTGTGNFTDTNSWDLQATGTFEDIRFNEIPVRSAALHWQMLNREHIITNPKVIFQEGGSVTAKRVVHTPATSVTSVDSLTGQVHPVTLLSLVAPGVSGIVSPYEFSEPPTIALNGDIAGGLGKENNFTVDITSNSSVVVPVCGKPLPLSSATTNLRMLGNVLDIPTISGDLLGGPVNGHLTVDFAKESTGIAGTVNVRNVDYGELSAIYRSEDDDHSSDSTGQGQLTGHFAFNCESGDVRSLNGKGVAAILNGNIFALRLFGPLSPLVEAVLPNVGIGYSTAKEATMNFAVTDGIFRTDDFEALTPAFKMTAKGAVNCDTTRLDMNARLNARGVAKVATLLFSYIFEFKAQGTLNDPDWKPLHFSGDNAPPIDEDSD